MVGTRSCAIRRGMSGNLLFADYARTALFLSPFFMRLFKFYGRAKPDARERIPPRQFLVRSRTGRIEPVGKAPYFTAPNVNPCTSCFCVSQPSTMIGATASREAAESFA